MKYVGGFDKIECFNPDCGVVIDCKDDETFVHLIYNDERFKDLSEWEKASATSGFRKD